MKIKNTFLLMALLVALAISAYADGETGSATRACKTGALIADRTCPPATTGSALTGEPSAGDESGSEGIIGIILEYIGGLNVKF